MKKRPSITIGIDLGDLKHAICVLNEDGDILEERTITNHRDSLRRLAKKYPGARVALEVGMHSPWISRFLSDQGMEVLVANARKLRVIYQNNRKSDEADAHILARTALHSKAWVFAYLLPIPTALRNVRALYL